jgi:hypothetical protein
MDDAAPVGLADGRGDADSEAQKAPHCHRRADKPGQWGSPPWASSASMVPTVFADESRRPHRPSPVHLVFHFKMMREAVEGRGRKPFPSGQLNQHGALFAIGARPPSAAEYAFDVLPQDLEDLIHRRGTARTGSSPRLRLDAGGRHPDCRATGPLGSVLVA